MNDPKDIPLQKIRVKATIVNKWTLLVILALVYVIFDFFSLASQDFLLRYSGRSDWKIYLFISAILVGVLYFVAKYAKIPFIDFEQV